MTDSAEHPRHTISTHVLDTERGVPAVGVHVTLYRLDVATAPIRMTQALTDGDGRIRDLLERPMAAGDYRIEFDVAHEDGSFFTKIGGPAHHRYGPQLSRAAAARAVLDDHVPGHLTAGRAGPRPAISG